MVNWGSWFGVFDLKTMAVADSDDFPDGGANPKDWAPTYYLANLFSQNEKIFMESQRNWPEKVPSIPDTS